MKRLVTAFTFLFFTFLSFSQDSNALLKEKLEKDTSYLVTGVRFNLFSSPLNTLQGLLETNNFAKLDETSYSFEVYLRTRRYKSSWDGSTSFGFHQRLTSNKQATNQASIVGFTSSFETGYNLTRKKMFIIKPFFGFGFEYYKLSFVEGFQSPSLSSISDSDFKNYNATSFQVPWTLGLEIGTTFHLKHALVEVLLRGGYKLHLESDKWKIDDVLELSDKINLSSPFVGFSFGFSLPRRDKIVYVYK